MALDLCRSGYGTYQDLLGYMEGSAAAIGTIMTPILEADDLGRACEHARQLGFAVQLTNFLRDVAEDLQRGRVYLPQADLERFGVARQDLATGQVSPAVREVLAFEVERARATTGPPSRVSGCWRRPPGRVSGPPPSCTAASWRRSSGPATRSWTAGSESPATAAWPWRPELAGRTGRHLAERRVTVAGPLQR
jgi:Squalene/phytoene synthase